MAHRVVEDSIDAAFPQASCRLVDNAPESDFIAGVEEEGEISENVLDLLALVKSQGADEAIRDALSGEILFESQGLRIGPVENGDIGERASRFLVSSHDSRAKFHFLVLVVEKRELGFVPAWLRSAKAFAQPPRIVRHNIAGNIQDGLIGAVVALEFDRLRSWEDFREGKNILYLGASEFVDGLIIIADDTYVGFWSGEALKEKKLCDVRVLVLIDENHAEPLFCALRDSFIFGENLRRKPD